jgi:hypothetical protein
MVYPSDLWEYCTIEYFQYELPSDVTFILQIRRKLQTHFHERHIHRGQIPTASWFGHHCEFCQDYSPSDKEIIAKACQIPTFAIHFKQFMTDFISINVFMNRLTRCGSGLEDYGDLLSLKMDTQQVIGHVLNKIRDAYD